MPGRAGAVAARLILIVILRKPAHNGGEFTWKGLPLNNFLPNKALVFILIIFILLRRRAVHAASSFCARRGGAEGAVRGMRFSRREATQAPHALVWRVAYHGVSRC